MKGAVIKSSGWKIIILCLSLLVSSCAKTPDVHLRIASDLWSGYEPLYLARDLGYLEKAQMELHELPNATSTINAFRNRAIDIAALTLDEALLLRHDGMELRILLVLDNSYGADVLMARPDITSLEQLKGKRIGLESGALGAYVLARSLEIAGLKTQDVIPVPVTINKQADAYRKGLIDALVTFDPVISELRREGAVVLLDSTRFPNEIFDVLVVQEDIYEKYPDKMKALINIWFQTLAYIQQNHESSVRRMALHLNLGEQEFIDSMKGIRQSSREDNKKLLLGENPALLLPSNTLAKIMLENKLIERPVDTRELIDKNHAGLLQ